MHCQNLKQATEYLMPASTTDTNGCDCVHQHYFFLIFLFRYAAQHLKFCLSLLGSEWRKRSFIEFENFFEFPLYTLLASRFQREEFSRITPFCCGQRTLVPSDYELDLHTAQKLLPYSEFHCHLVYDWLDVFVSHIFS